MIRTLPSLAVFVLLAGCATQPVGSAYPHAYGEVFAAAQAALFSHGEVRADIESGVISTSWSAGVLAPRAQGVLQDRPWPERVRYEVRVRPGTKPVPVEIFARVERRAPGGPRSLRWERIPSEGKYEERLLDAIAKTLQGDPK